jgi:CCR4-NOT transcription complex subunit 6
MMQNSGQNFTQSALQNGTAGDEQDLGEPVSEHWQTQLQLATELRQSGLTPHRHSKKPGAAVLAAKGTIPRPEVETQRDVEQAERRTAIEEQRQDWDGMDLSGQGLRSLSPQMFVDYTFLTKLRIDQNRLGRLPDELCQLRNLTLLDASANQLREIPDGIGMLTNLRTLLLFDNSIRTFPKEIGHLYKLEVLGIDGNPIDEDIKDMLKHGDAQSLIVHIRDRTEREPAV